MNANTERIVFGAVYVAALVVMALDLLYWRP